MCEAEFNYLPSVEGSRCTQQCRNVFIEVNRRSKALAGMPVDILLRFPCHRRVQWQYIHVGSEYYVVMNAFFLSQSSLEGVPPPQTQSNLFGSTSLPKVN